MPNASVASSSDRPFRNLFSPLRGCRSSRLLADPHDPGCAGRSLSTDSGRIALTLDAGGELLGCAPVCEGGGPKPGSILRDGRRGSFGFRRPWGPPEGADAATQVEGLPEWSLEPWRLPRPPASALKATAPGRQHVPPPARSASPGASSGPQRARRCPPRAPPTTGLAASCVRDLRGIDSPWAGRRDRGSQERSRETLARMSPEQSGDRARSPAQRPLRVLRLRPVDRPAAAQDHSNGCPAGEARHRGASHERRQRGSHPAPSWEPREGGTAGGLSQRGSQQAQEGTDESAHVAPCRGPSASPQRA